MTPDYQLLWDNMLITDEPSVIKASKLVLKGRDRYEGVVEGTSVPWQIVGVTHYRESSCNFKCHPHEGSPLTDRTKFVPIGRPKTGNPPFTWEESAKDCYFTLKKLDKIQTWDIPTILGTLEAFNGMGYVKYHPEVLSPYLWAKTGHYTVGKYASDGKFDPELVDKQCGVAGIYRFLTDKTLGLV
jgi:lysozyme family protein